MDPRRRFALVLAIVLLAGAAVRVGYVVAQPEHDPSYASPGLDAAYNWDWSSRLISGEGDVEGAYYRAPLYPWLLAGFRLLAGDRFGLLYLLQHLLVVLTAGTLALCARRLAGDVAGVAAAVLWLTYHPAMFFASLPAGESLAVALLAAGTLAALTSTWAPSGLALGVASLARPNLVLVPLGWAARFLAGGRARVVVMILAGTVAAIAPVALRNAVVSGHVVPVSANAGMTLYQGNREGATGVGMQVRELSGDPSTQRDEATRAASMRAGEAFDAVEADRFWLRRAFADRAAAPLDTLRLGLRRLALFVSSAEISVDAAPGLDANPWRLAAPLPFGVLLALAAVAAVTRWGGSGRAELWTAIGLTALTPLAFYVSSRYRLPAAALLAVAAGIGVAAIVEGPRRTLRVAGLFALFAGVAVTSFAIPVEGVARQTAAVALSNRATAWKSQGRLDLAARDLNAALAADSKLMMAWFGVGVLHEDGGRPEQAEAAYRRALALQPGTAFVARNLSGLLVRSGRAGEAVAVLRAAIDVTPWDAGCWNNLVVAHVVDQDTIGVRRTIAEATAAGVSIDPDLLADVAALVEDTNEDDR